MKKIQIITPFAVVLLASCSTEPMPAIEPGTLEASAKPQVEEQLMHAAKSIEQSLLTLADAQKTKNPPLIDTAPLVTPEGGMGGSASIDWTGPIAPLLVKISQMTDYRLKVLGTEPAIPVVVTIKEKQAIIADIVKNAGLQAGKKATIMVFPQNRVIELRYSS